MKIFSTDRPVQCVYADKRGTTMVNGRVRYFWFQRHRKDNGCGVKILISVKLYLVYKRQGLFCKVQHVKMIFENFLTERLIFSCEQNHFQQSKRSPERKFIYLVCG